MLRAVVSSLDEVEESHQSFYEQKGEKFILQVSGADELPDVANLRSAYRKEQEKRTSLSSDLEQERAKNKSIPEDFDLDVWNKAKTGETDEAAIEAAKIEVRKGLEKERDDWKGKYQTLKGENRKKDADAALNSSLMKAGVSDPAFLEASRAMLSSKIVFDDDGTPTVKSDMGPLSIGDYVERWAKDEGKSFVKPPKGGGNDEQHQNTGNNTTPKNLAPLVSKVPGLADLPVR